MRQRSFIIFSLSLLLALSTSISATAQTALFEKFEDTNGITTIFISKTMLKMIPEVKAGNHDISQVAGKLDQLRIFTCEKPSLIPKVREFALKTFREGKYEAIMTINDSGEKVTIYQRSQKEGKNEFSLFTEEKDELTVINIIGAITLKDIKDITGK